MPPRGKRKGGKARKPKRVEARCFGCHEGTKVFANYVMSSAMGCHVVHGDSDWIIGRDHFDPEEWDDPGVIPDLSLDPETLMLTAINTTPRFKSFFISFPYPATGKGHRPLQSGIWRERDDEEPQKVITLIAILYPLQVIDLCLIEAPGMEMEAIALSSDIKELPDDWDMSQLIQPSPPIDPVGPYLFPLAGEGPFLCSQGNHGGFTHFYPQTCFAVDLECPIGTSIVAVGEGEVVEVMEGNEVSGIHVDNLFKWNSLTLRLSDGVIVEYVHIKTSSAVVKAGDRVKEGDILCHSGSVGFCPAPHLHLQFHRSRDSDAPTVPFLLRGAIAITDPDPGEEIQSPSLEPFCPMAGTLYQPLHPL
jgi:hypothetical protein